MNVHKTIKTIRKKIKKMRSAEAAFEMPCAEAQRIEIAVRQSTKNRTCLVLKRFIFALRLSGNASLNCASVETCCF